MNRRLATCAALAIAWTCVAPAGAATPAWRDGGVMRTARGNHAAVSTPKGLLLAGGSPGSSAELWDPTSRTSAPLPPLPGSRDWVSALPYGTGALITGGRASSMLAESSTAELWDGSSWTVSIMKTAHAYHTATLVGTSGRVLVVGGSSVDGEFTDRAEVFDGSTWTEVAPIPGGPVAFHAASFTIGGVLVSAGTRMADASTDAYVFDASSHWRRVSPLSVKRLAHTSTTLLDGRVLVVGGSSNVILSSVEIFDPLTSMWKVAAPMHETRALHSATLLADGRVLVVGGFGSMGYSRPLSSAELYDPASDRWYDAGTLSRERYGHGLTALDDGRAVVTGAAYGTGTTESDTIEIFERRKPGESCRDDGECLNLQCIAGTCLRAVVDAGPPEDAGVAQDGADVGASASDVIPDDLQLGGRACGCRAVGHERNDWAAIGSAVIAACIARRRQRTHSRVRVLVTPPRDRRPRGRA